LWVETGNRHQYNMRFVARECGVTMKYNYNAITNLYILYLS